MRAPEGKTSKVLNFGRPSRRGDVQGETEAIFGAMGSRRVVVVVQLGLGRVRSDFERRHYILLFESVYTTLSNAWLRFLRFARSRDRKPFAYRRKPFAYRTRNPTQLQRNSKIKDAVVAKSQPKDTAASPDRANTTTLGGKRRKEVKTLWERLKRHGAFVGPGVVATVAYIDPGNWATDLQAGSQYGYAHLFIILLTGFFALLFQLLATRLGCVSGIDLAEHCRISLHDRPKHKLFYRWGVLYPLYALSEIGIVFTDLAELLGSAIAINLLIPQIPLSACVVLTSLDVLLILLLFSKYPSQMVTTSMRAFEFVIGVLVITVLGSFVALLVKVSPVWKDVFHGYVPGPGIVRGGGLYVAVGILGATVMPHAVFIASKMATMRRLAPTEYEEVDEEEDDLKSFTITSPSTFRPISSPRLGASTSSGPHLHLPHPVPLGAFDLNAPRLTPEERQRATEESKLEGSEIAEKPSLACVRAHLGHAVADVAGSLLGFAILINSSILILAAAVFYYGDGKSTSGTGVSDLFDAFDLVKHYIGPAFAYIFAVALLAAGQSASLTVTLTGQIISEGFIQWRTKPWKRRLITRLIGIVPSLAVAIAVGRDGIDVLLVGSQVALSIILPFVLAPLIFFTSSHYIMSHPISPASPPSPPKPASSLPQPSLHLLNPFRKRVAPEGYVSFANSTWIIWTSIATWVVIIMANMVAIVDLAKGDT